MALGGHRQPGVSAHGQGAQVARALTMASRHRAIKPPGNRPSPSTAAPLSANKALTPPVFWEKKEKDC